MKHRLLPYLAIAFAMGAVWFFFVLTPAELSRQEFKSQIEVADQQLADFTATMEQLPVFLKTSNNLTAFRRDLNSSLYDKQDIMKLFDRINDDAGDFNLEVRSISPPLMELLQLNRTSATFDEPQFLNLSIDFRGQYIDLARYVRHIEKQPYFRQINAYHMRGDVNIGPTLDCRVTFKAIIRSLGALSG